MPIRPSSHVRSDALHAQRYRPSHPGPAVRNDLQHFASDHRLGMAFGDAYPGLGRSQIPGGPVPGEVARLHAAGQHSIRRLSRSPGWSGRASSGPVGARAEQPACIATTTNSYHRHLPRLDVPSYLKAAPVVATSHFQGTHASTNQNFERLYSCITRSVKISHQLSFFVDAPT